MPSRGEPFVQGECYHICNRGVGRSPIFFSPENYTYCLRLLKRGCDKYRASVIAYCLMPNHYHLLMRQEGEEPLSKLVGVVFNGYVQAVNRQQSRSGTLFEGRFRHVRVDREEYSVYLCYYIHLNPVKANLVTHPGAWPFSNYLEWVEKRNGTLKDEEFIRAHFGSPAEYERCIQEYQGTAQLDSLERYALD